MAASPRTRPVEDTISKVGDELAVGEDLQFQQRWWHFEHIVWLLFTVILALDLAGVFGRGPLAKATAHTMDGTMTIDYERVERFQTPSVLTVHFGKNAVQQGKVQLWVSDTLIKPLGNQRIIPAPQTSTIAAGGILYTWPATNAPDSAAFALEPSSPGVYKYDIRIPTTGDSISRRIFVMP